VTSYIRACAQEDLVDNEPLAVELAGEPVDVLVAIDQES